jgi:hypothetical protein
MMISTVVVKVGDERRYRMRSAVSRVHPGREILDLAYSGLGRSGLQQEDRYSRATIDDKDMV